MGTLPRVNYNAIIQSRPWLNCNIWGLFTLWRLYTKRPILLSIAQQRRGVARITKIMSCEESAIFFANLAYIPNSRQNPSIFSQKNPKERISTEVVGTYVSTTFYKLKMNEYIFGAIIFKVIEATWRGSMGQKMTILYNYPSIFTNIYHCFYELR